MLTQNRCFLSLPAPLEQSKGGLRSILGAVRAESSLGVMCSPSKPEPRLSGSAVGPLFTRLFLLLLFFFFLVAPGAPSILGVNSGGSTLCAAGSMLSLLRVKVKTGNGEVVDQSESELRFSER